MSCCRLNRAFVVVCDPVLLLLLLLLLIIKQYCLLYKFVVVAFGKHLHNDHFIGKS